MSLYLTLLRRAYAVDMGAARARNRRARAEHSAFQLSDFEFQSTYRLTKALVRALIEDLTPYMPEVHRSDGIDTETQILVALAFFAVGCYQRVVGQVMWHFLSQPSVSRSVRAVAKALNNPAILNNYVTFPLSHMERDRIKMDFYSKFGMPGVLGCIDGTHVAIVCPADHEERFYCRKGYHSLNVAIICDANMQILAVDASHPGSMHDSKVWEGNPLHPYIENLPSSMGEDIILLGDSGYPLRRTMMTPILGSLPGTPERKYYEMHVSTRNIVERCIGALKTRFRCLLLVRTLHYEPQMAAQIVNACCVLHNIANGAFLDLPELSEEEEEALAEELRQSALDAQAAAAHRVENPPRNMAALEAGRLYQRQLVQRLWRSRH